MATGRAALKRYAKENPKPKSSLAPKVKTVELRVEQPKKWKGVDPGLTDLEWATLPPQVRLKILLTHSYYSVSAFSVLRVLFQKQQETKNLIDALVDLLVANAPNPTGGYPHES